MSNDPLQKIVVTAVYVIVSNQNGQDYVVLSVVCCSCLFDLPVVVAKDAIFLFLINVGYTDKVPTRQTPDSIHGLSFTS